MGVVLKQEHQERWLKLDQILARSAFDPREVYGGGSKEKRREEIADGKTHPNLVKNPSFLPNLALSKEVTVVQPSRLLTLLGQALKFQQLTGQIPAGTNYDIFRGKAPEQQEDETYPRRLDKTITV